MLDYFYNEIKPLNDRLGRNLNMKKTIEVEQDSHSYTIPVTIEYTSHTGNRVKRRVGTRALYEALGLVI